MRIRDARPCDAEGVAAIYNDAVRNTTAIWNEAETDAAGRAAWLAERRQAGFPVLVAVDHEPDELHGPHAPDRLHGADRVLGYATFGHWRAWDGYRHTVEHSVYVHRQSRGRGVGLALLHALIERARGMGMHVMVAGIEAGNEASLALHRKCGFTEAGVVRQAGCKFGRWLDLAFLQLTLDSRPSPPERAG